MSYSSGFFLGCKTKSLQHAEIFSYHAKTFLGLSGQFSKSSRHQSLYEKIYSLDKEGMRRLQKIFLVMQTFFHHATKTAFCSLESPG